jgi:rhamnogalacturonan endolyase
MPRLFMSVAFALLSAASVSAESFGFKTDTKNWILSSGKGLTITMVRASCDIVSIKYNGQELQSDNKGTQLNSGLGNSVTSSITTLDDAAKTIQITCEVPGLAQYYFLRANENALYMGTYHSSDLKLPELRFLARLSRSTVTTGVPASTLDGTVGAIEAHDIYVKPDNTTRSKFYSGVPFIEDQIHGVSGPKAGVYFVMSPMAYETSIGGPFYRDINNQCTTANELTFYMNSDHTRTEDYRFGFHGPYALVFTNGAAPPISATNFDFFQGLGLKGFVDSTKRGTISGTIKDGAGVLDDSAVVVGSRTRQLSTGPHSLQAPRNSPRRP